MLGTQYLSDAVLYIKYYIAYVSEWWCSFYIIVHICIYAHYINYIYRTAMLYDPYINIYNTYIYMNMSNKIYLQSDHTDIAIDVGIYINPQNTLYINWNPNPYSSHVHIPGLAILYIHEKYCLPHVIQQYIVMHI